MYVGLVGAVGKLVEVLRVLKRRVQGEENVERLYPGLMDGDVEEGAQEVDIRRKVAVEVSIGQALNFQKRFQLGRPLLQNK